MELARRKRTIRSLARTAAGCRACDLWRKGTQTVFGEGASSAEIVLVGEQPGDQEDIAGRPFVGPAGRVLSEALDEAGIDADAVYVTNVVKHFKWKPRDKRRIHDKPSWPQIRACLPWLEAELAVVEPKVVVCLGATAAQALLGRDFRVSVQRGKPVSSELVRCAIATIHPSAVLRAPTSDDRLARRRDLVEDLRAARALLEAATTRAS